MVLTMAQIEESAKEMLTCEEISGVMGANPYTLHMQAELRPDLLGFPVVVLGRRVKIPRRPFLKWIKGE